MRFCPPRHADSPDVWIGCPSAGGSGLDCLKHPWELRGLRETGGYGALFWPGRGYLHFGQLSEMFHQDFTLTMCNGTRAPVSMSLSDNVREVALERSDGEIGQTDREDIVNLTGMDNANEGLSHHDDMKVCAGQGGCELIQRLVGEANDIAQALLLCKHAHLVELTAATDEAKDDCVMSGELFGGLEQGVQRMTGTVIARVHHHALLRLAGT